MSSKATEYFTKGLIRNVLVQIFVLSLNILPIFGASLQYSTFFRTFANTKITQTPNDEVLSIFGGSSRCSVLCSLDGLCNASSSTQTTGLGTCVLHKTIIPAVTGLVQADQWIVGIPMASNWTLVFKVDAGLGESALNLWSSSPPTYDETSIPAACIDTNMYLQCPGNFRSNILDSWTSHNVQKVHLSIVKDGFQVAYVLFDGRGSDMSSWFSKDKILDSSWPDLKDGPFNYFSIKGDESHHRRFFIQTNYGGCNADTGYLVVSETETDICKSYWIMPSLTGLPKILYSMKPTKSHYAVDGLGAADSLFIFVS